MRHVKMARIDEKTTESAGPRRFLVDVDETIRIVLEQEDTDGDFQVRYVPHLNT